MRVTPSARLVLAILLLVQVLFGINYLVSKIIVSVLPPLVWASLRCLITTLLIGMIVDARGIPHPKGGWKFFGPLLFFSLLSVVLTQSCFLLGLRYTSTTNSAVLTTLIPVFTLAIVIVRGQERLTWRKAIGFMAAFIGVLIVLKAERFKPSDQTLLGDALIIINCLSYATYLGFSKRFLELHDRVWVTFWLFFFGSVPLTLIALPDYYSTTWPRMGLLLWSLLSYAVIAGTLFTYLLINWVIAHTEASYVALFVYIQPLVAALAAWAWIGETPSSRTCVGGAFIFTGVYFSVTRGIIAQAAANSGREK